MTSYFTKDGLQFLTQLKTHNEKAWFEKNKPRYEAGLREPGFRLIADLEPALKKVSKHFAVDPRPNGGSFSRIYRDTRFSKDKSPYNTALFMHFQHEDGDDEASPGFYLRIAPGGSKVGGGVWRPAPPKLAKIRDAIVEDASGWKKAKGKHTMMIGDDALKKVPRGYDPEHVHAEDLKRKHFGLAVALSDSALTGDGLVAEIAAGFRVAAPMVAFLCRAVGLSF